MKAFDGRKVRDEILADLKEKISKMDKKPGMAVILVGENEVSDRYADLKKKTAEKIGIVVKTFKFDSASGQDKVLEKVRELNEDSSVNGIMVQIPVPAGFDKSEIVNAISPEKDIDGLRFCAGSDSHFLPPVVLAIRKAIEEAGKEIEKSKILVVGKGFLVGNPLARCLDGVAGEIVSVGMDKSDLSSVTKKADIIISATGKAGLIKPEMVETGVALIDAGTSEVGGELKGDIDPACYEKASFYTPVPGGIGPVTVAMLLENLVKELSDQG